MTRLLIIIPAEILNAVRTAAEGVFGKVAQTTFAPAGSPTGNAPITHWWAAGVFEEADLAKVEALKTGFPSALVATYNIETQAGRPLELLKSLNLKPLKPSAP